eukprot:m.5442 g.5442  ORF g.5442 m.5442 type:complete len:384 (+) comp3310_c1_seq1:102-1253(+)
MEYSEFTWPVNLRTENEDYELTVQEEEQGEHAVGGMEIGNDGIDNHEDNNNMEDMNDAHYMWMHHEARHRSVQVRHNAQAMIMEDGDVETSSDESDLPAEKVELAQDDTDMRDLNAELLKAVEVGNVCECELLLCLGANPNASNERSEPVVFLGMNHDEQIAIRIIKLLLKAEANPNSVLPYCGWVPLHKAAARGFDSCVKVLIMYGGDYKCTKADGLTPADLAMFNNNQDTATLMEYCGKNGIVINELLSLRQLTAIHVRKRIGQRKLRHIVDKLPIPAELKYYLNYYEPYVYIPETVVIEEEEEEQNCLDKDSKEGQTWLISEKFLFPYWMGSTAAANIVFQLSKWSLIGFQCMNISKLKVRVLRSVIMGFMTTVGDAYFV